MTERASVSVSVVIPYYRARKTIERALASVRAQTVVANEIILVDDASNDGASEYLWELVEAYPSPPIRIYLHPANMGAATARNTGWNNASGDYVAFLDADDAWLPQKLELQHAFMIANPLVIASGHRSQQADADMSASALPGVSIASTITTTKIGRWSVILRNPCVTPSVMVRRELDLRFLSGKRYMEDHYLWQQIVLSGHALVRLEVVLVDIFKPLYGASGLSSHLWRMESAELQNYELLQRQGYYSRLTKGFLITYSLVKFLRRLFIVAVRRLPMKSIA